MYGRGPYGKVLTRCAVGLWEQALVSTMKPLQKVLKEQQEKIHELEARHSKVRAPFSTQEPSMRVRVCVCRCRSCCAVSRVSTNCRCGGQGIRDWRELATGPHSWVFCRQQAAWQWRMFGLWNVDATYSSRMLIAVACVGGRVGGWVRGRGWRRRSESPSGWPRISKKVCRSGFSAHPAIGM